jgi:hypothetical protein
MASTSLVAIMVLGVDVVGGQRHQVAGALLLVKGRSLRRQAGIQARAQFDAQFVRRPVQAHAPADAQHVDGDAERNQLRKFEEQRMAVERMRGQAVDGGADGAGNPDGAGSHAHQHESR